MQKQAGNGQITTYSWDARNRLIGIDGQQNGSALTARFKYDALGRRQEKTINGSTVQYLYDGANAIAELRGNAIDATLLTGLQIDEMIARYPREGERTLLTDALGSVILTTKDDQTVATAYGYSPYGETQVMGTEEGNSAQYTARENDRTGLYYYRARYYDPQLKRWLSEDPIGLAGGMNVYTYVKGNPVSYVDPLGLEEAPVFRPPVPASAMERGQVYSPAGNGRGFPIGDPSTYSKIYDIEKWSPASPKTPVPEPQPKPPVSVGPAVVAAGMRMFAAGVAMAMMPRNFGQDDPCKLGELCRPKPPPNCPSILPFKPTRG